MKIRHNSFIIGAALAIFTACQNDNEAVEEPTPIVPPHYTVGEADNAIILRAGINEGANGVITRASIDGTLDHSKHREFTGNTQIVLRIDGTWKGHTPSEDIKQQTVATLDEASDAHNVLKSFNPVRYWDDYGMADPANMAGDGNGRDKGLTIYGAAVNGKTSLPESLKSLDNTSSTWNALSWQVCKNTESDIVDQTSGWSDYDLLTSNNVVAANDNAFKFENRDDGKLLEFTHAMTKITVVLTAGEGFPGYSIGSPENACFEAAPTVTLEGFYTQGSVDVELKESKPTETITSKIKMYCSDGGATHTAKFDALVFPGNIFADGTQILSFTADGNTFLVTAAKLNVAIQKAIDDKATTKYPGTNKALQQAWDYVLNITVNKTDIKIFATIRNWDAVEAEKEEPVIAISETYGHTGSAFTESFDFFRSTSKISGYSNDAYVEYSEGSYVFHNPLYWPDHQTHYFFRGVFPRVQTGENVSGEEAWIPSNKILTSNLSASTIAVENVAYSEGTYPSDLAFGWPRKTDDVDDDETCKVHSGTQGICATEGGINMNFKYVMSKVQVSLKSSGTAGKDKVDLSDVEVQIINGYRSGKIQLSDGKHADFVNADKADSYTLSQTTAETGFTVTTLDAIVPQDIADNVKIRIIVKDNTAQHNILDVYETQLNQIEDSSSSAVTEWEPGKWYKYQLDILKTEIKVKATITDWKTVNAGGNIWF